MVPLAGLISVVVHTGREISPQSSSSPNFSCGVFFNNSASGHGTRAGGWLAASESSRQVRVAVDVGKALLQFLAEATCERERGISREWTRKGEGLSWTHHMASFGWVLFIFWNFFSKAHIFLHLGPQKFSKKPPKNVSLTQKSLRYF